MVQYYVALLLIWGYFNDLNNLIANTVMELPRIYDFNSESANAIKWHLIQFISFINFA